MSSKSEWEQICDQVQKRLLESAPMTVKSATVHRAELLKCLTKACDDELLKTKHHEIYNLLKKTPDKEKKGIFVITGGMKNQKRLKEIPHFERFDGALV